MRADASSTFGELLRRYRATAGLTQEELAERAGLSGRGIADLERGARAAPYPRTIRQLADALRLRDDERAALLAARNEAVELTRDHRRGPERPPALPGALPLPLSSFIGREPELAELCQLVQSRRSVTLVGPGGVGKTRLALEIGTRLASEYADGVCLVRLAPLAQGELVVQATAGALGIRVELDRQPTSALTRFLATRRVLLLLDNCEHLLDYCADLVVAVLEHSPGVHFLATSREPLRIEGETVWRLMPLDERDAVRLFVERARAQSAAIGTQDEAVVRQLCRRLDHLPLAIELAAARVGVLAPGEILPRLENRFALLTRQAGRGGSPRHQTLRATVDWSYELLEPAEQQLFRRLAVFAGRFDLAAANAMGGPDTLDVLGRLVDKSLVLAEPTQRATRYRLLVTLRSYAWERLREAGEAELAAGRHVDHFLGRAEDLYVPTESVDGPTRELDENLDDLRTALEWCARAKPAAGLRLTAATVNVWWRQSCAEGRQWARLFLDRCPSASIARCRALYAAGRLEVLADAANARRLLADARGLAITLDDQQTLAMIDGAFGLAALRDESPAEAIEHLNRALATTQALRDVRATARILTFRAWVMLSDRDRLEEAREELAHVRRVADEVSDRWVAGAAEFALGLYWRRSGHTRRALEHFRQSIEFVHTLEEVPVLSEALLQVARLLAASEPARAARLAGARTALAERTGIHDPQRTRRRTEQLRDELAMRLGSEQARWLWNEGERMSSDQVVALALERQNGRCAAPGGLTPRELEVGRLVADGLTSQQVADVLHLSRRTIDSHLARIFTKVGLSNRLQLATWLRHNDAEPPG
jgi:predicted ATPase/DNA-binding CsgD family transcriptional regulator/DNA-binding XRE family transcriptional regulator